MRQRFVGFGGTNNMPVDTWVLNLRGQANWQPLPVDGNRPNGGYGMTSVYDAAKDRMLIFGGSTSDAYYGATNDVWELKLRVVPQWTKIITDGVRPIPRRSGSAAFDPLRNRMVIYGGWDAIPGSDQWLDDTWALDFDSDPPAWTELHPAGTIPGARACVPAAYDPLHDQMIIFGGWNGINYLADTQFLGWGGESAEAQMSASSSATPTSAHVEWQVQDATGTHAAVYRRTSDGQWTAVAEAEVDATGQVAYDDTNVSPGSEYDYMMVVGSQRGETFGGEASVTVPGQVGVESSAFGFALQRVTPNPVAAPREPRSARPAMEARAPDSTRSSPPRTDETPCKDPCRASPVHVEFDAASSSDPLTIEALHAAPGLCPRRRRVQADRAVRSSAGPHGPLGLAAPRRVGQARSTLRRLSSRARFSPRGLLPSSR